MIDTLSQYIGRYLITVVCMYVCKDSAEPAHARARAHAHRPAAPHQSSGVSQTPHPTPTARPQAGIPHRPP